MSNIKKYKNKSLSASEYYYGCKSSTWNDMKYFDAIEDRYNRSRKLYFVLLNIIENKEYKEEEKFDLEVRIFKIEKAMNDNGQLLDERGLII